MHMQLEIFAGGKKHVVEMEDISRTGMFLRMPDPLPEGTLVHLALHDGEQRYVTSANVAHSLDETDARALGRSVGLGVELRGATRPGDVAFPEGVERILAPHVKPTRAADRRIVVATSH